MTEDSGLTTALGDVDGRPYRHPLVQRDHIWNRHPDAAMGGGGAQRAELVGAMDPGAVEDPEPAGLERILRRPAGDDRARERAGPGAVRHGPGRVHSLVLDVVEAR